MKLSKLIRTAIAVATVGLSLRASSAVDTAVAAVELSGMIPVVFTVQARGLPGDIDLSPGAIVVNRAIGIFHFRYNESVAAITVTSTDPDGFPNTVATGFKIGFDTTGCTTIDATKAAGVAVALGTTGDMSSATAKLLTTGLEEDCKMYASFSAANAAGTFPLAGLYKATITLTMTAP